MEIPLGNLQFSNITFRQEELAEALRDFVIQGSQKGTIGIDDLTIIRRTGEENVPFTTVADAVTNGTRLFDALAYFSLPANQRPQVTVVPLDVDDQDPSMTDISRSVFFVFMWILIRGGAPHITQELNVTPVPRFLSQVMGFSDPAATYVKHISSFDLALMHHGWVKFVQLGNLGQEAQNRLALGVAGYRLPAALCLIPIREDITEDQHRAVQAIRAFVRRGLTWDCFGHTRSNAFLQRGKNFNKNIGNLILDVADPNHIQRFVDLQILFAIPVRDERFTEYLQWDDDTFASFVDYIFPQSDE